VFLPYSTTDLPISLTFSTVLSKLSSTPVNTSTVSLPASFIVSKAPLKSPCINFKNDCPIKPVTSNNSLNLTIIPS
jgi:hypothetical protein